MATHQTPSQVNSTSAMSSRLLDIDTVWEMAASNLLQNNNQIVVPERIAVSLTDTQILELKSRLSQFCGGAPTVAMGDTESNGIRICLLSSHPTPSAVTSESGSPLSSDTAPSSASAVSPAEHLTSNALRTPGKKSKVPRPANAFILYRQHHHPHINAANPDYHNNDISILLGKKWRSEPDTVKTIWKTMAEKLKKKHAQENPGYQYAPRKASEKKRRMTARKLAAQRAVEEEQESPSLAADMVNVAEHERSPSLANAATWLGVSRPSPGANFLQIDDDNLDVNVTLPAPQQALRQQVATHYEGVNGLLPFNPRGLSTAPAPQPTNEQDFLNSLIDWDDVRQDMEILRQSTGEARDDLAVIETGNPQVLAWDPSSNDEFQKELERIMRLI